MANATQNKPAATPAAAQNKPAAPVAATGPKKVGGNVAPAVAAATAKPAATAPAPAAVAQAAAATVGTETPPAAGGKGNPNPVGLKRDPFDFATGVDGEGKSVYNTETKKLTGIPANWDMNKHKKLNPSDFDDEAVYSEHQAAICDTWAQRYTDKAAEHRASAERIRKFGDPEQRKKAAKLEKMRKEYLQYRQNMINEGLPVDDDVELAPAK